MLLVVFKTMQTKPRKKSPPWSRDSLPTQPPHPPQNILKIGYVLANVVWPHPLLLKKFYPYIMVWMQMKYSSEKQSI